MCSTWHQQASFSFIFILLWYKLLYLLTISSNLLIYIFVDIEVIYLQNLHIKILINLSSTTDFSLLCVEYISISLMMMKMMNCFCSMVDRRKVLSLIFSLDHCQRSSPSPIFDTPPARIEPEQNLSSGLVEWSCAVVITTTPQNYPATMISLIYDKFATFIYQNFVWFVIRLI